MNIFALPCNLFLSGIMDSQAKCWKESMFGGPSSRNTLYSWEELSRGNIAKYQFCFCDFSTYFLIYILIVDVNFMYKVS